MWVVCWEDVGKMLILPPGIVNILSVLHKYRSTLYFCSSAQDIFMDSLHWICSFQAIFHVPLQGFESSSPDLITSLNAARPACLPSSSLPSSLPPFLSSEFRSASSDGIPSPLSRPANWRDEPFNPHWQQQQWIRRRRPPIPACETDRHLVVLPCLGRTRTEEEELQWRDIVWVLYCVDSSHSQEARRWGFTQPANSLLAHLSKLQEKGRREDEEKTVRLSHTDTHALLSDLKQGDLLSSVLSKIPSP